MNRWLLLLLPLLVGAPAFAQPVPDSLFVPFPTVVEEVDMPDPVTPPVFTAGERRPLSLGMVMAGGASKFTGEEKETFGGGGMFLMDGQVSYGRVRGGLGMGVGLGKLLDDYYYKGPWPKGEYYTHSQFYLTLGADAVSGGNFRITPYAGYGFRVLSYEYYHGSPYEEDDDPSLSYTRSGPCLFLGLESALTFGGDSDALGLLGRVYASRSGIPGLSTGGWAIHFAIGIVYSAFIKR